MLGLVKRSSSGVAVGVAVAPSLQTDVTANDSDKTFTVPANKVWNVLSIFAKLVTDATVGNRTLKILITTATDVVIWDSGVAGNQAASLTKLYKGILGGQIKDNLALGDAELPLPSELVLPAGYKIRVYDSAAIAVAADDMDVHILVDEVSTAD